MRLQLIGSKSTAIFDPLRLVRGVTAADIPAGERVARTVLGVPVGAVELVLSIPEQLFYRTPMRIAGRQDRLSKQEHVGELDLPDHFEAESLFRKAEPGGILRQSFLDQYPDYEPYRLDINLTPLLDGRLHAFRIMRMDVAFSISPALRCTDVFPQTKWIQEGLAVNQKVYLDSSGKYRTRVSPKAIGAEVSATAEATLGQHYFYEIKYDTEVPEVVGQALHDGFGWQFRGTFAKFVECGTKFVNAVLLVPRGTGQARVSVVARLGITDADRRDPTYPADRALQYYSARVDDIPLAFRTAPAG